jgi:hypothetical protein
MSIRSLAAGLLLAGALLTAGCSACHKRSTVASAPPCCPPPAPPCCPPAGAAIPPPPGGVSHFAPATPPVVSLPGV